MLLCDRPDYTAVFNYLCGLKPQGTKLGIDRMRPFAAELGQPECAIPVIHVAGTNGKGSVAAMLESVLREAGWRVGLYTSPHLQHLGERVQVDRKPLTREEIVAYTQELDLVADRVALKVGPADRPSFFEFVTAMAFLHFKRRGCDIAVIETGLGGEFDATNIVRPLVSVITSIGLDHREWLGDTIEEIASAKAGIIKAGCPVIMGRMPAAAEHIIREKAKACGSPVISVAERFGVGREPWPTTNLEGEYQRWNAATATLALQALAAPWIPTDEIITRGLHAVHWPGRWQRISLNGRLGILDSSHNIDGAAVLAQNLQALVKQTGRRPIVITGILGAERARPLIDTICRYASKLYFVVPAQPRATSHAELQALVPADYRHPVIHSTVAELFPGGAICTAGKPGDVIVITGSLYLLGEVMGRLAL